jgi:hypothetical protein
MRSMRHVWSSALALGLLAGGAEIGHAAVTAAPGWAVRSIPTPGLVQGGVIRHGDVIFVGQGPTFTGGAESVVRMEEGGSSTTIATGFNALGGFDLSAGGTLYAVDNGLEAAGAVSGDTLYAVTDATTRTVSLPAASAEVLPSGSIDAAQDVLVTPAAVLVSDAVGPGAGRVVQVVGTTATDLITGLDYTGGLALDGATLLVGNLDGSFVGSVQKYDLSGAAMGTLVGGLSGSYAQVVDAAGDALVSGGFTPDFSSSTVVAVDPLGVVTERARGFSFSGELFFDAARDETLVLDFGASAITAICRDSDQDGTCDADEPCTVPAAKAKVVLKRLGIPVGDETFSLKAEVSLPVPLNPPLDPVARGVRVRLEAAGGGGTDVSVPPGPFDTGTRAGWKANHALTSWKYSSKTGVGGLGITKVTVKSSPRKPGVVRLGIKGKGATLELAPDDLPLSATVKLDPAGQCALATFSGPDTACAFNASQTVVRCK